MLDADLLAFIRGAIRSTWALEMLLLMRTQPERAWSVEALARDLRATPALIYVCLSQLEPAGLIGRDAAGALKYAPASPALDQMSAELDRAYRETPVATVNAIMESPDSRLRTFADAFRFTRKDQ